MLSIAVDGGGSKLIAIVFNENGNIISVGKGSTVNLNFVAKEEVEKTITQCIDAMLDGIPDKPKNSDEYIFESVYMTMAGPSDMFITILNKKAVTKKIFYISEGAVGLYAGALCSDGLLALSGTGSDCFLNKNGVSYAIVGGWGAAFGDEGSGYWLGAETIRAAIRSYDGRGEKSMIEELVMKQFDCRHMWDVSKLYRSQNQRKDIASATKSLSQAVWDGDAVAKNIITEAARIMAEQSLTLLRTKEYSLPMKFTVAGGGWKTSELMINHYVNLMVSEYPQLEFVYPHFEPVVGGIIDTVIKNYGEIDAKKLAELEITLKDYKFLTDDAKRRAEK